MPIDPDFLSILVCPETRKPLRAAESSELEALNGRIRSGGVRNRGGDEVRDELDEGLVPEGVAVVYPVRDGIPILLAHEAIALAEEAPTSS